ncbi:hypothetical protein WOLCODRAFT_147864 [Wolfiporia cocos MD-104 SS10]|uniref:F-box domain-containing protein n=1 Tax=Wolfiporia cocos (strain MD-104) TaxID=742152 RepID=A0A2H3IVM7_WOLCO|nr:hypothetical protein WOLCODRAFT_147864 [Wolfiporia cocos MD-104 SS10]
MDNSPTFLTIPFELRLPIYEWFLTQHRQIRLNRQPSSQHLRFLRICKQIYDEASPLFYRYISLRHERQINAFILHADQSICTQVTWADVANDGRVILAKDARKEADSASPLSNLHIALRRMPSLKRLRVFPCRQGLPFSLQRVPAGLALDFETAMYPSGSHHQLRGYELYLEPETKVTPFAVISPESIELLRLTGDCHLPASPHMPALCHLTLHAITGNHFDLHTVVQCFPGARLESFCYGHGDRLGFEFRNRHLESLIPLSCGQLRKLVLLGCSRLTSTAIATCLDGLPQLDYFALSLITVDELRTNFVLSLSPTISVVKLHIINAWYAIPLIAEERGLCDALETTILNRKIPPRQIWVNFRDRLMIEEDRRSRWREIAYCRQFMLAVGPWNTGDQEDL